ncbi:MAG: Flp family type IVb pilin [Hyphomicrobiales bacterium]|nr:Flp family type IVb pilin [Hyphomicrobiales bacterium]
MRKLANLLKHDEDGAALIEYTVLIGLMLAGVVATVTLVGTWASGQWTTLNSTL